MVTWLDYWYYWYSITEGFLFLPVWLNQCPVVIVDKVMVPRHILRLNKLITGQMREVCPRETKYDFVKSNV